MFEYIPYVVYILQTLRYTIVIDLKRPPHPWITKKTKAMFFFRYWNRYWQNRKVNIASNMDTVAWVIWIQILIYLHAGSVAQLCKLTFFSSFENALIREMPQRGWISSFFACLSCFCNLTQIAFSLK